MCPFCLATLGMVVAGTVSTGGLAAIVVKLSRRKNDAGKASRIQMKGAVQMSTLKADNPRKETRAMATSKERDKEHPKEQITMKTPPVVSQQDWEAAQQQ